MPSDDIKYYRIRQRQELLAADISIDDCCRTIHLDLARRYAMRVTELEANSACYADDDRPSYPSRSPFIS